MDSYDIITNRQDVLARKILDQMYPGETFSTKEREEKALKDVKWMLQFVVEGLKMNNERIIENLIIWFRKLFTGLKIEPKHADLLFDVTKNVLHDEFQNESIDMFLNKINVEKVTPFNHLNDNNPYQSEKNQYLQALLDSDRNKAYHIVMDMVEKGVSIPDIYLFIFQESMRHIGVLWHEGKIQVGREHYATVVTQYIMSSLYTYIFNNKTKEHRLLACTVGSELHEMGIRMVADVFEMNGWDTNYLGANLPYNMIIDFALEYKPDVIALSITMPYHLSTLKNVIDKIKEEPRLNRSKIIVGGMPFLDNIQLYHTLGADGYAPNALEGLDVANNLL